MANAKIEEVNTMPTMTNPLFKRCAATMSSGKRKGKQCIKFACKDRDMCYVHIILMQPQHEKDSPIEHKRSRRVCFEDEERTKHTRMEFEMGTDLRMEDRMEDRTIVHPLPIAEPISRIIIPFPIAVPISQTIIPLPIAEPIGCMDQQKIHTFKRQLTNAHLVY
jgi:hypothetical protein